MLPAGSSSRSFPADPLRRDAGGALVGDGCQLLAAEPPDPGLVQVKSKAAGESIRARELAGESSARRNEREDAPCPGPGR